jgi:2-polyprenyl-3-methyl-5-hydroxy-6-metoxy-1,4-benzoquinol methylase
VDDGAFEDRIRHLLNASATTLLISVGHQAGLFDAMAAGRRDTAAQIAASARASERYVREWLGGMVVAGIVRHDPQEQLYWLPPEHARWLTRDAGVDDMASLAALVGELVRLEDDVVEAVRSGGGIAANRFTRASRRIAAANQQLLGRLLVPRILGLVPGLQDDMARGIDVLDLGCGFGYAVHLLAGAFPRSRVVGYDVSAPALAEAQAEAERLQLTNARFARIDAAEMQERGAFDLVLAFETLHDQAHPERVVDAIARALRPAGVLLVREIRCSSRLENNLGHAWAPFLSALSCAHCVPVARSAGGDGLGALWGEEEAMAVLRRSGFRVERGVVDGDDFDVHYVCTRA